MATGVLGLGSEGASALNQDVIDQLKEAERKATVEPIENRIDLITSLEDGAEGEEFTIIAIEAKIAEFTSTMSTLDVNNLDANVFDAKDFNIVGTSAQFSADDMRGLPEGITTVNVTQVAQKDVYQTSTFSDKTAIISVDDGSEHVLSISVGNETYEFDTIGKSYEELATEINANEFISASVEQVGDESFRLVIKSAESGLANSLSLQENGVDFGLGNGVTKTLNEQAYDPTYSAANITGITINGDTIDNFPNGAFTNYSDIVQAINNYTEDGEQQYQATTSYDSLTRTFTFNITALDGSTVSVEEVGDGDGANFMDESHVLNAQNMKATIDGISYDTSSNQITTVGGLKITATSLGESSLSVSHNTDYVLPAVQEMVDMYNALVDIVDEELYDAESPLQDTSSLRMMMAQIKDILFSNYGAEDPNFGDEIDEYGDIVYDYSNVINNDKNLFQYGLELDKTGHLSIDTTKFAEELSKNPEGMSAFFVGSVENEGLGSRLSQYLKDLTGYTGLLTQYDESMASRLEKLQEERDKAIETLDSKYEIMTNQFIEYAAVINQMEATFSGLKMMIDQSTASN